VRVAGAAPTRTRSEREPRDGAALRAASRARGVQTSDVWLAQTSGSLHIELVDV
jgi:hypothetical protein